MPPPRQRREPPGARRVTLRERALGAAVTAARPLLPLSVFVSRRMARAAAERRGVVGRLRAWAEAERDPARPLLWLHGASAGELTGAASVLEALRDRSPVQVAVSYFSPSAEPVLPRLAPDVAEPLPLDALGECRRALAAVEPDAVVFARGDVWPNFTRAAARLGIPLGMVNGAVAPDSSRLRAAARWLTRPAYGRLERVGAVSEEDAARLVRLGVDPGAIRVTGDAALDTAAARLEAAEEGGAEAAERLRRLLPGGRPVVVGGSTWREDEEVLIEAAKLARSEGTPVALVLVPHEPDEAALGAIDGRVRRSLGAAPRRWSEARTEGAADPDAPLVVDEVGVLADLYPAGDVAWVGGGYGDEGLHSVVEPAAAGVPVLFGDRTLRPEAEELVRRGGGRAVPRSEAPETVLGLARDRDGLAAMGRAARGYVEEGAGAARAAALLVIELVEAGDGPAGEGRG